jgi:hypothetical protein
MYRAPDGRPKEITRGDAAEAIEHLTGSAAAGPQAPPRISQAVYTLFASPLV